MIKWILAFIPYWILGFFIGVYSKKIGDALFNPPRAFVLRQETVIEAPKVLEESLSHQKK